MSKIFNFFLRLGLYDFARKVAYYLFSKIKIYYFFRGLKAFFYLKNFSVDIGKNVLFSGQIFDVSIGKNVTIYPNVVFEFANTAKFIVGDNSLISYGVIISCKKSIAIGQDVQIGEYTSIRDSTHTYKDLSTPMKYAKDLYDEIIICDNVWIGRGCIIMPGTIIEDGVVVGANSVVKGLLERNKIYGGNPVKFLKSRTS
jgi:acetyltransferase-like isoleucine patch superfamily enzyme